MEWFPKAFHIHCPTETSFAPSAWSTGPCWKGQAIQSLRNSKNNFTHGQHLHQAGSSPTFQSTAGEKALFWRGDLRKETWVGTCWLGRNLSSRRNRSFKGLEAGMWHSWQEGNWAVWAREGTAKAKMAKLSRDILALWAWCVYSY